MSHIYLYTHAILDTHNTYRCHKVTSLVKDVTSNLLGGGKYDYISNVPSLTENMTHLWLVWIA